MNQTTSSREFHPLASLFPILTGEEYAELVADIKAHGLREPIWLYEDKVLDGRNRYSACQQAGIDPEYRHFSGTRDEARDFVISLNLRRRHLTAEQKREVIAKLIEADPSKSDRQIAATIKASHTTVGTVRSGMEGRGQIGHVDKRTDTMGREQPSTKPSKPKQSWARSESWEDELEEREPVEPAPESQRPRFKREPTILQITLATIDRDIIEKAATFKAEDLEDFGADLMIRAKTLLGDKEGGT